MAAALYLAFYAGAGLPALAVGAISLTTSFTAAVLIVTLILMLVTIAFQPAPGLTRSPQEAASCVHQHLGNVCRGDPKTGCCSRNSRVDKPESEDRRIRPYDYGPPAADPAACSWPTQTVRKDDHYVPKQSLGKVCGKTTWAGCGHHVEEVKRTVPAANWCPGHESEDSARERHRPAARLPGSTLPPLSRRPQRVSAPAHPQARHYRTGA